MKETAPTASPPAGVAHLACVDPACPGARALDATRFDCPVCASIMDVAYDWDARHRALGFGRDPDVFRRRGASLFGSAPDPSPLDTSGVWRFRELMPFYREPADIVTLCEGRTILRRADALAPAIGFEAGELFLQYEGLNPSGSFKDNGMTGAFTHARMVGARRAVCASTGNTSASMAMFASGAGIRAIVLVGSGRIAYGKLSQALEYGARTLQVEGDFDACMRRVRQLTTDRPELGIYLMNSLNPFRLEGQKSIMFRVLEALGWEPPDWVVVPGGNLGNCSAFAKAFSELRNLGMIDRVPRLAIVNARGARTLDRLVNDLGVAWDGGRYDRERVDAEYRRMDEAGERASTVASAIEINRPVNLDKALRAIEITDGVVRSVDDETIMEHKAMVGRTGFGCEPASGASVAGARLLREQGVIRPGQRVVCILTGHLLKDPDAVVAHHTGIDMKAVQDLAPRAEPRGRTPNPPVPVADDLDAIIRAIAG